MRQSAADLRSNRDDVREAYGIEPRSSADCLCHSFCLPVLPLVRALILVHLGSAKVLAPAIASEVAPSALQVLLPSLTIYHHHPPQPSSLHTRLPSIHTHIHLSLITRKNRRNIIKLKSKGDPDQDYHMQKQNAAKTDQRAVENRTKHTNRIILSGNPRPAGLRCSAPFRVTLDEVGSNTSPATASLTPTPDRCSLMCAIPTWEV